MKKLLMPLLAIIVLLLMVAWMAGAFRDKIEPGLADAAAVNASDAVAAVQESAPYSESVPASVEAKEATIISSRLLARITAIEVRAGDFVDEGQLLLTLEKKDLLARAQQARDRIRAVEARLTEARQNLTRAEELHKRGLIAVADRDAARADAASLEAELASARQALEEAETAVAFSEIRSPIAGRVVDRFAEPGDTASPGEKLLSLYNPFSLRVEARVREQLALSLEQGQMLEVQVPSLEATYQAKIEEIVPAADPGSRSFLVKAILPSEKRLLPGMYARVRVPAGERERLLVPVERVGHVGQLDVVWVAEGDKTVRRFVRLGRETGDGLVEVISGLSAGDKLLPQP
ncbi:efflux RND transporter periplasmic adaptor subunit [Mangrovimicrobium sediminis]|uniref:Efflux RND transporter periplasmic adaptor subunit n=1 Tax=Mangrovimicrobium sediminis TaxID=2562682 RepID=A0A4Z0LYP5_9GAMM|nr:efflux RND transporter periplasmic adaptor subunit [Haliea sp. SAOS-164]TGD72503.1 efflux RND transporter periplasmic adaptor subunit [Haliea sp. SAOS-164]